MTQTTAPVITVRPVATGHVVASWKATATVNGKRRVAFGDTEASARTAMERRIKAVSS